MVCKCVLFADIGEFQKIVGTFIEMVDTVAKEVESEKMKVFLYIIQSLTEWNAYMHAELPFSKLEILSDWFTPNDPHIARRNLELFLFVGPSNMLLYIRDRST